MTIAHFDRFRIEYGRTGPSAGKGHMDHFFDVQRMAGYPGYAVQLETIDHFGYCAVVKFTSEESFPHRIVFFPSGAWFREWLEGLDPKPEVLCQFGREEAGR